MSAGPVVALDRVWCSLGTGYSFNTTTHSLRLSFRTIRLSNAMTSELIFPELATNFSQTLTALKRSTLSISNRLQSIVDDSEFVCSVAEAYKLPLVANERCGSWYIAPERKAASAYFKSTDGHAGQWSMSLRRLNIQVLNLVSEQNGYVFSLYIEL